MHKNNTDSIKPLYQSQIFTHFAQYIRLSPELKAELAHRISIVQFNKGDLVHSADKICKASYFIQKGLLRTYYLKEEKEISEYFCAEGEWVNSPRSFMQQQLDIYSIDAIEPTLAFKLQLHDLGYLFDHFPEMERYARLSMGGVLGHLMERVTSSRFTSAKEKYQHFCEAYADIYHRIPLGMVASYMGITQETLSRIRAEK
ncbi:MAG: Crp/Fnr family transcriptional regulator [Haliscomenobacter sp.]|uniref:Crp/Fnr family transcriptional regulator n=1 Tax=Haliscomenobacter sp. TaxID=2717303 RepID=UPI0029A6F8E9|nr:Crp/Fnr family transcriptional regulator [Haliscomenobacter sp.]MDX2069599.1 Crp/Fnr family transcriptional regulator [Haliscomenobacter sp.]